MSEPAPLGRFVGKVALITGAASGIGHATAQRLAAEGAAIAIVDIDAEAAEQAAARIRADGAAAMAFGFDVADRSAYEQAVQATASQLGPIDVLVNNAALGLRGRVVGFDATQLEQAFQVNIKGMLHGMDLVAGAMLEGRGGAIVNMASMAGIAGVAGMLPYTMSKGAMVAMTRSAAMELAPLVRVNAIAPGKVVTAFRARMFGAAQSEEELRALGTGYPLQRVGVPEDIAGAVAFLASDDASWITGITLPVDGGKTSGFHEISV